jgi:hypothetical protein
VSLAGELTAVRTRSGPQNKFLTIWIISSLFWNVSVFDLRRRVRGAMNTGDSKQTAISFKKRLLAKKFRLGRSRAKLMNLSFSFFSIKAMVLFMYVEYASEVA